MKRIAQYAVAIFTGALIGLSPLIAGCGGGNHPVTESSDQNPPWKTIPISGNNVTIYRLEVEGGFLYVSRMYNGVASTFVPNRESK